MSSDDDKKDNDGISRATDNGQAQLTVAAAYRETVAHFSAGKYTEAEQLCTSIINTQPNHMDAINLLGVIAQKNSNHQQAVALFQRALNIDCSNATLYYNQAISLYQLGHREEAIKIIEAGLTVAQKNRQLNDLLRDIKNDHIAHTEAKKAQQRSTAQKAVRQGLAHHQAGSLDAAIDCYQLALQHHPENAVALSNLGLVMQSRGKLAEAINYHLKSLAINPNNPTAHFNLGAALQEQGKLTAASESYQQAINIKADFRAAYTNLGNIQHAQGKLDQAVGNHKKVIAIAPDAAEAHYNLGVVLHENGELQEAVRSYQQAIALKPDSTSALSNLGLVLTKLANHTEAEIYHQKAIIYAPDNAKFHYNYAVTLYEQGKLAEAATSYQNALAIDPDHAQALSNLGNILAEQKNLTAAISCLQKAIAIKADFPEALLNLGKALIEDCQLAKAITTLKSAITIKPDYSEAHINLGKTYLEQGKWEAAKEHLQTALSIDPDNIIAKYNMGYANLALGNLAEGWQAYELRLTLNPNDKSQYFSTPRWQGEALQGKTVLVYDEQGVGDEVRYASLYAEFAAMTKRCFITCDPRLLSIFQRSFPNIEFIGISCNSQYVTLENQLPQLDFIVAAGSLTGSLRPAMDGIKPYLVPDPKRVAYWRQFFTGLGPEPKVGISWTTASQKECRMLSHSSLDQWSALLTVPGVQFINLFYGDADAEIAAVRAEFGVEILNLNGSEIDLRNDLDDLAAMMCALDVTVSSLGTTLQIGASAGCNSYYFFNQTTLDTALGTDRNGWVIGGKAFYYTTEEEFQSVLNEIGKRLLEMTEH